MHIAAGNVNDAAVKENCWEFLRKLNMGEHQGREMEVELTWTCEHIMNTCKIVFIRNKLETSRKYSYKSKTARKTHTDSEVEEKLSSRANSPRANKKEGEDHTGSEILPGE